jgi:sulfate adenylyltransferase subunit 1
VLIEQVGGRDLVTIPVSALEGDNVVDHSPRMPWYGGPTLLDHLESVPVCTDVATHPFRMPVQRVIRPDQNYRGFAGQISAGTIRKGDFITVLPSGRSSRVASITTFDGDLEEASAPLSIALTLEDELDISRGDLLSEPRRAPQQAASLEALLVWFDNQLLETHRPYLLKHGATTRNARVSRVVRRTNVHTLAEEAVNTLGMNDIGVVEIELTLPLFFDAYTENRASGSFILIDPQSNATLAAGMIRRGVSRDSSRSLQSGALLLVARSTVASHDVEEQLIAAGAQVVRTRIHDAVVLRSLLSLGLVVLFEGALSVELQEALAAAGIRPIEAESYQHTKKGELYVK